ncbi:hypothetical protein BJ875DRAFT_16635 [Amylocarpus encephaloides]|uniref:Secreted protein n=1 Tax=Amylocarpus encephaloides TaxID=45428 RepID=A0A9P7YJP8_9HELO|nr:hypothetical protein BJ875DRAFT_16635 [Amylocarpus encephaloides]
MALLLLVDASAFLLPFFFGHSLPTLRATVRTKLTFEVGDGMREGKEDISTSMLQHGREKIFKNVHMNCLVPLLSYFSPLQRSNTRGTSLLYISRYSIIFTNA